MATYLYPVIQSDLHPKKVTKNYKVEEISATFLLKNGVEGPWLSTNGVLKGINFKFQMVLVYTFTAILEEAVSFYFRIL